MRRLRQKNVMGWVAGALVLAGVGMGARALAQGTNAPAATSGSVVEQSYAAGARIPAREFVQNLGVLKYPLLACSVLTVALILYFLVVLRLNQVVPRQFYRRLMDEIATGQIEDMRWECESNRSPFANVALAAIDYVQKVPNPDPALLKDVMEGEGARQAEVIEGQIQYLLDVVSVAPMLGLLGTVFGMTRAFKGVAQGLASAKPIMLAGGVAEALYTTAVGLIISITALIFYAIFRRLASKLVSQLELASIDVLTALNSRGTGRLAGEPKRSPRADAEVRQK